jgi:hypothetical protein
MGNHVRNKVAGQLLAPEVTDALNRERELAGRDDASLADLRVVEALIEEESSIRGRHRAD